MASVTVHCPRCQSAQVYRHGQNPKLMKEMDIASCQVPAHKYKRGGNEHVEIPNHLDRQFAVTAPDQVWCGDVTYIWTGKCWTCSPVNRWAGPCRRRRTRHLSILIEF